MKKCPFCNEVIGDKSITCYYCGRRFHDLDLQSFVDKKTPLAPGVVGGIFLYMGISVIISIGTIYFVNRGTLPSSSTLEDYCTQLTSLDTLFVALIGFINLVGATAVILLRKKAFNLFITGMILNVLINAWMIFAKDVMPLSGKALLGVFIVSGIMIGVRLYARYAQQPAK